MSTIRNSIREYLAAVGPSSARQVAQDLGQPIQVIRKALSCMGKLGTAVKLEGSPLRYGLGREPMPVAERVIRASKAAEPYREATRLDPETRREKRRTYCRTYYQSHAEQILERRRARPKVEKPKAPKPVQRFEVKRRPIHRVMETPACVVSAVKLEAPVKCGLPDTDAFLRANPHALIRLEQGVTSQPRDRLTAAQRRAILTLEVA